MLNHFYSNAASSTIQNEFINLVINRRGPPIQPAKNTPLFNFAPLHFYSNVTSSTHLTPQLFPCQHQTTITASFYTHAATMLKHCYSKPLFLPFLGISKLKCSRILPIHSYVRSEVFPSKRSATNKQYRRGIDVSSLFSNCRFLFSKGAKLVPSNFLWPLSGLHQMLSLFQNQKIAQSVQFSPLSRWSANPQSLQPKTNSTHCQMSAETHYIVSKPLYSHEPCTMHFSLTAYSMNSANKRNRKGKLVGGIDWTCIDTNQLASNLLRNIFFKQ